MASTSWCGWTAVCVRDGDPRETRESAAGDRPTMDRSTHGGRKRLVPPDEVDESPSGGRLRTQEQHLGFLWEGADGMARRASAQNSRSGGDDPRNGAAWAIRSSWPGAGGGCAAHTPTGTNTGCLLRIDERAPARTKRPLPSRSDSEMRIPGKVSPG